MWKAITEIKKLVKGRKGERKKQKITAVLAGQEELPLDLVFDLCLRLPIHKLFQFMCISYHWRSIISCPDFSKAYYSRNISRVLVLSLKELDSRRCSYERQFYHSLLGEQWTYKSPLKIPKFGYCSPEFTQVINGLVCAYSSWSNPYLCNIFTGEKMALPDSGDSKFDEPSYYFAFDPVYRLYKFLRLVTYDSKVVSCKILTLSSSCTYSSWRKLAVPENVTVADYVNYRRSIVINGVLFLYSFWGVIAFNFADEKFHSVPLPILFDDRMFYHYGSAQSRGRLALMGNLGFHMMIIYMLNDINGSYSWTRRKSMLPRELQGLVVPVGSLPTGEILLAPNNMLTADKKEPHETFTVLYSYDYEKDKYEKFEVGKLPRPVNLTNEDTFISCVEVGSLDALIHGDGCFR